MSVFSVTRGDWHDLLGDPEMTSLHQTGLTLLNGARYSMRVAAINKAGYMGMYDTNGVIIDTSPPTVRWCSAICKS